MNLYKIVIRPITSFCSPLQSDTFFGAFCWSYLYQYGEQALQEFLQNYKTGKPDIIFSNAFPAGRVPMPMGINSFRKKQDHLPTKQGRYQKYVADKKKDHLTHISLNDFNRLINGGAELSSDFLDMELKTMSWRNMVNRETNTVENIDGESCLFEVEQIYSKGEYDVYISSTFDKEKLDGVLKQMFQSGIGAQRSVGKGAFNITGGLEIFNGFETPKTPNAFVALSNFIPRRDDPANGYYKTFVKYPKVSYVSSEEDSPFKKPLIFLTAGSVFYDQPIREFYGSCMEKVALKDGNVSEEIVIGAYTIAIPCYLNG